MGEEQVVDQYPPRRRRMNPYVLIFVGLPILVFSLLAAWWVNNYIQWLNQGHWNSLSPLFWVLGGLGFLVVMSISIWKTYQVIDTHMESKKNNEVQRNLLTAQADALRQASQDQYNIRVSTDLLEIQNPLSTIIAGSKNQQQKTLQLAQEGGFLPTGRRTVTDISAQANASTGEPVDESVFLMGPGSSQENYRPKMLPGAYTFREELQSFRPSVEQIFLGRSAEGPILLPMSKLWHIAFTGPTGGGKSSAMRMILAQLLDCGATCYLCDIHYAPINMDNGLDWRPIEARLAAPPLYKERAILEFVRWLALDELERRKERNRLGQPLGKAIFFAIEELPAMVEEFPEISALLSKILRQGRKYGIYFMGATQDMLVKTLGTSSGVRECFRTGYYTGGDPHTAKAILDLENGQKLDETGLGENGLVYLKTVQHKAIQVRVPWPDNEAIVQLLGAPSSSQSDKHTEPTIILPGRMEKIPELPMKAASSQGTEVRTDQSRPGMTGPLSLPAGAAFAQVQGLELLEPASEEDLAASTEEEQISFTSAEAAEVLHAAMQVRERTGKHPGRVEILDQLRANVQEAEGEQAARRWNRKQWPKLKAICSKYGL